MVTERNVKNRICRQNLIIQNSRNRLFSARIFAVSEKTNASAKIIIAENAWVERMGSLRL